MDEREYLHMLGVDKEAREAGEETTPTRLEQLAAEKQTLTQIRDEKKAEYEQMLAQAPRREQEQGQTRG